MRTDGTMNVIDFGTRKIIYTLHREDRKRLRPTPPADDVAIDAGRADLSFLDVS